MKKCKLYINEISVSDLIHNKMLEHFRRYLIVGGMPEAVKEYVNSKDINKVTEIQLNIIEMYKKDFTKYEAEDKKLMIISIYDLLPLSFQIIMLKKKEKSYIFQYICLCLLVMMQLYQF